MLPLPSKSYSGGANRTDAIYNDDEVEFLKAIVKWRNKAKRNPTCVEVLEVAKTLGYRRLSPNQLQLLNPN